MNNKENFPSNNSTENIANLINIDSYQSTCFECIQRLQEIWLDMEVPKEQISERLKLISVRATGVWEQAVSESEEQRNELRKGVENAIKEIRKIQDQLGEAFVDENLRESTGTLIKTVAAEAQRTMKSLYDEVMGCANEWKKRKDERVREFEQIHEQIMELKGRLGQFNMSPLFANLSPNKLDISQANLEFLVLEKEKLQSEKSRRERKLEAMLSRLRKVCIELGEDDLQIAQSVHPSLQSYRDSLPGQQQYSGFNQMGQMSTPQSEHRTQPRIELGDQLFKNLQTKIDELQEIKVFREERLTQISDLLSSLWFALEIPETDIDRDIFTRLLNGGAKLHDKTMEKCMAEVSRLEGQKSQQMMGLIQNKERVLQQMCEESHLIMPDMTPLLYDIQNINAQAQGQVTNVLSKMMRMVEEAQQLVQKRQHIVKAIEEVNLIRDEVDWLNEYEMDENRFKGRDSNRKLQRSIKAGKQREKLPHLLKKLQQMIEEWEAAEGVHFQFDNYLDYKVEVLEPLQSEVQQQEQDRQKGHKQKQKLLSKPSQSKLSSNNSKPQGSFQDIMRPQTAQGRLNSQLPTPQNNHQFTEPSFVVSSNTPRTPRTHQFSGITLTPIPPSTAHTGVGSMFQSLPPQQIKPACNILQDKLNRLLTQSPLPAQRQNSQEEISRPMECSQGSGNSGVVSGSSGAMASFKAKMLGSQSNLGFSIPPLPISQTENIAESQNTCTSGADMMTEDENMEP